MHQPKKSSSHLNFFWKQNINFFLIPYPSFGSPIHVLVEQGWHFSFKASLFDSHFRSVLKSFGWQIVSANKVQAFEWLQPPKSKKLVLLVLLIDRNRTKESWFSDFCFPGKIRTMLFVMPVLFYWIFFIPTDISFWVNLIAKPIIADSTT